MASGGFGDDPKKVEAWAHKDPEGWKSSVNMNKTGDGIQMALDIGAQMGPVSFVGHYGTEGTGIKFISNLYTTSWQPAALWVNSDGNRFTNEGVAFSFSQAANAIYSQYDHYAWSIFDGSQVKYMMEKGIDSGIGVIVPVGQKLPNLQKEIDEAISLNSESFKAANSVEQLAKEINVPEKNLAASIDQYNKWCEQEHDNQFFKEKAYLRPLDTKNLYAIKLKSYFFSSYGGLRTNRDHQVLDKNNKPIKGLYAAGLEVSDMVGPTYTTWSSGHAFGFASYSGRHAAKNAAESMK
ncbi:MAG: FAD-binding protein [Burkholderiales bacterium]|nr:FAD-binding protein [Burkholderiales bacterium]